MSLTLRCLAAAAATVLGGCGGAPRSETASIVLPPVDGAIDYQLGGDYDPPAGVTIVARDVTGRPADGLYSICYVNAFQTQPGDTETFPVDVVSDLEDPGYPGEFLIDISTVTNRRRAAAALEPQLDTCREKGFQAVELDNLDSWTRFDDSDVDVVMPFGMEAAIDYAGRLVALIHDRGLAAGQKNTPQLARRGPDEIGFDFVVSEQCGAYDECGDYTDVYGDHVIDIEYDDSSFAAACAAIGDDVSVVRRDIELSTPGSASYVFDSC